VRQEKITLFSCRALTIQGRIVQSFPNSLFTIGIIPSMQLGRRSRWAVRNAG